MRTIIHKKHSTKTERIVAEFLKEQHLPFRHRVKMLNHEIDLLVDGKGAIEIDGHEQSRMKNKLLIESGVAILHLSNRQVLSGDYKKIVLSWLQQMKIGQD